MHKQGKNKLLKAFNDRPDLVYLVDIFYESNADRDMIANNGYKIISLLYSKKRTGSLNSHRYQQFVRCSARATFQFQNIPPTEGAAKQHIYRSYLQLQKWMGNDCDATQWGWKVVDGMLLPHYTDEALIPSDILKKNSCRCETGCKSKVCSCKKHGLKCSNLCLNCNETVCCNFEITHAQNIDEDSCDLYDTLIDGEEATAQDDEEICDSADCDYFSGVCVRKQQ